MLCINGTVVSDSFLCCNAMCPKSKEKISYVLFSRVWGGGAGGGGGSRGGAGGEAGGGGVSGSGDTCSCTLESGLSNQYRSVYPVRKCLFV